MTEVEARIQLEPSWKAKVGDWLLCSQMQELSAFLRQRKAVGARVFPPGPQIFAAFDATPFDQVKVVILGQDPYHAKARRTGCVFRCCRACRCRRRCSTSTKRYRTIWHRAAGSRLPDALGAPGRAVAQCRADGGAGPGRRSSEQGLGSFTDHVVETLNREREGLVFLLWGSYAQSKGRVIDQARHRVFKAPHPSPLSAHRGFLGCQHFSKTNAHLQRRGISPIDWSLPPRNELDTTSAGA